MRFTSLLWAVSLFLGAAVPNAFAQGDVAEGERLAQEFCSRCHNVEPLGAFKQYPPSFASIAVFRSREQIEARILFPPLHSAMPQIYEMLSRENVDSLTAYIVSLENK